MNIAQIITNITTAVFGVSLAGTVVMHDANIDKAMTMIASAEAGIVTPMMKPSSHPHTHSERGSLHQAIRDLNASQPRTQPRTNNDKKYVQAKPSARGHHPFDNYTLPLVG